MARTKITLSEIERLAKLQCTYEEAGSFFGISGSAFSRLLQKDDRAQTAWARGSGKGRVSLRRKQTRLAGSNAAMAIWLGKQYLKQDEVIKQEVSGKDGGPIETTDMSALDADERKSLREHLNKIIEGKGEEPSE